MDRKDPGTLLAYQRAEHERAKMWDRIASWLDYPILIIAIAAVFTPSAPVVLPVAASIFAIGRWLLSEQSARCQYVAERARRAVVLQDGLDIALSGKAFSDMYNSFSASEDQAAKYYDADYYSSQREPGPSRLAELLEESAFWSKDLYRTASKWTWAKFSAASGVALLSLILFSIEPDQTLREHAVQVFCILVVMLVAGGLFARAMAFSQSASYLDDVEGRIPLNPQTTDEVLPVFGDYNAAVQAAPAIPSNYYRMRREKLNQLWRDRKGP